MIWGLSAVEYRDMPLEKAISSLLCPFKEGFELHQRRGDPSAHGATHAARHLHLALQLRSAGMEPSGLTSIRQEI